MSSVAVLAGITSTAIFAASTLPMLRKAAVTRDLDSYSLGNIGLANLGNAVHSVYVLSLPPGPIWVLHAFYVLSSALMLVWYLRYVVLARSCPRTPAQPLSGRVASSSVDNPLGLLGVTLAADTSGDADAVGRHAAVDLRRSGCARGVQFG